MKKTIAIAAILAALTVPALAQSDPHHPDQGQGQGVIPGQYMMWGQGMMGPGMSCPIMGMGMMGFGNPHTEGRLAFLKTELKITASQESTWNSFADVLRAVDKNWPSQSGMIGQWGPGPGMMDQGVAPQSAGLSAPDALKKRVEFVETHLANLKKFQAATAKLYRELDDSQKKTADQLLGIPCGF